MISHQTYGLSVKTIDKIITVLKSCHGVQKVILFGSRAKGNFKEGSDIDIALTGDRLNLDTLRTLEVKIDDLMLAYDVDLLIYNQIKEPELKKHIDQVGVELG